MKINTSKRNQYKKGKVFKVNDIDSILLSVTCFQMSIVSVYGSLNRPSYLPQSECSELSEAVDAVYTWVNGSDPEFLRSLEETDLGLETHSLDISPQRYEGLLYRLSNKKTLTINYTPEVALFAAPPFRNRALPPFRNSNPFSQHFFGEFRCCEKGYLRCTCF